MLTPASLVSRRRGAMLRSYRLGWLPSVLIAVVMGVQGAETMTWRRADFTAPAASVPIHAPSANPRMKTDMRDGAFHLVDNGTEKGDLLTLQKHWCADPETGAACEAEVKVLHCDGLAGVMIGFSNGTHEDILTLYEDRVELYRSGASYAMDTTDDFHVYRIDIRDTDVTISVDGNMVIEGKGTFTFPAHRGRNRVSLGSGASNSTGESLWRWVAWTDGLEAARKAHPPIDGAENVIIFKNEGVYAPFPSLRRDPETGTFYTTFSKKTQRTHHETLDSSRGVMKSTDGGQTWSPAADLPDHVVGSRPREIFTAEDGALIRIGQNWRRYFPPERLDEFKDKYRIERPGTYKPNWFAINSGGFVARSENGGDTWSKKPIPELDTYVSCSSPWSFMQLRDGRVMRTFMVRADENDSGDVFAAFTSDGQNVTVTRIMGDPEEILQFTEETLVHQADDNTIWVLTRVGGGDDHLWQGLSTDGGHTWTARKTGIKGHPPSGLVDLGDGKLVLTYGYRHPPYGIRAVLSRDGGVTWDTDNVIVLRNDGAGYDLGYPRSMALDDDTILTVYYFVQEDNVTHIAGTRWSPPFK